MVLGRSARLPARTSARIAGMKARAFTVTRYERQNEDTSREL